MVAFACKPVRRVYGHKSPRRHVARKAAKPRRGGVGTEIWRRGRSAGALRGGPDTQGVQGSDNSTLHPSNPWTKLPLSLCSHRKALRLTHPPRPRTIFVGVAHDDDSQSMETGCRRNKRRVEDMHPHRFGDIGMTRQSKTPEDWLWYAIGTIVFGSVAGLWGLLSERVAYESVVARAIDGIGSTSLFMLATVVLDPLGGGPVPPGPWLRRTAYPIFAVAANIAGTWILEQGYGL